MHTRSRTRQSSSNNRRKGTPRLVASLLHDDYPGQMDTLAPISIMHLVQAKIGVRISYSTALREKNQAVSDLSGSPEENYKMLYCYLYMLENANPGTIIRVKLDEKEKFKYLFIVLGASIEGFKCMRKVIVVHATFLKNGFGGVLVFASAQEPNRHNYPIAFAVLDGENNASRTWFFEMLKSVMADNSELVFMSDRNLSLISVIANVYLSSHHGYCVWHLSQNVKSDASNVNKDVVAWRLMECSRYYTVDEFERAYSHFQMRYPSAAKYLEHTTQTDKWARCYFLRDRYNLDTSNIVESLNSTFRIARMYSLIPMVDAILKKICDWFSDHRKEVVAGPVEQKLVPLVDNLLHDMLKDAKRLHVDELNSFGLEYSVIGSDAKSYLVNLLSKSYSCRVFDIEKYPCMHRLAAFITLQSNEYRVCVIQLHELCSRYYWVEQWALAYHRTIYLVPHQSELNVPDYIKEVQIMTNRLKKGKEENKKVYIRWRKAS